MRLFPLTVVCVVAFTTLALLNASPNEGKFLVEKFRAPSLEGNFLGDSPEREVSVYLPAGYDQNPNRRYAVLYFLHGNNVRGRGMDFTKFFGDPLPRVADKWIHDGTMNEMIIVFPNSNNRYGGSQYADSETSGRWASFIVRDVVSYIDKKFRTLPKPESRGLAGHSMGGRGALYLALRFPGVFGAVYAGSAGAMAFDRTGYGSTAAWEKLVAARDDASVKEATADIEVRRVLTYSVAFSPNRNNPPFFADFPKAMKDGVLITRADVASRWADFDPVRMVESDAAPYRQLRALHFDCGTADRLIEGNRLLAAALKTSGVAHTYEEYDGDHNNRFVERVASKMLPMFSAHLILE